MISIENLTKQFGPQMILNGADLFIGPHDRIGLVGPNGAGKTTLFRLIVGEDSPDGGALHFERQSSVGLLSQESQCRLGVTVREEMRSAFPEADTAQQDIERLSDQVAAAEGHAQRSILRQLAQAQTDLEMQQAHTMDARIGRVLHGLGFKPGALDRMTDEFSGGWQMRIAMAKLLLREPDLLLFDEPTNHLDVAARKWLENYLEEYPGAVFLISHEPQFLNKVVDRIVELEEGKLNVYPGNYHQFQKIKEERRAAQQAAFERQQRELEKQQEFIDRFGAKATKASAVKSREKQLEKIEKIEAPKSAPRPIALQFPAAPKSAQDVLRLRSVTKNYGDHTVLLDINLKIARGQRLALLGPNGAGKSTLLRIMAGSEQPSEGTLEFGHKVITGYFAQHQAEALDPDRTVLKEVLHGLELQPEGMARNLLGRLHIRADAVYKPVRVLSGGERSRVALAKFLLRPANFLLLDEPTNHLDPASREVLQEALKSFDGTLVIASHDRPFVNAVAQEAYVLDGGILEEERLKLIEAGKKKGKSGSPAKS